MATELAKAYVQIIPSAEGISGSISDVLSGETKSAGKDAGNSLAGSLVGSLKGALVGLGVGKLISDSIGDTSAFESGMAKVSTLFTGTDEEFKQLTDDMLGLSSAYGISAQELTEAAYSAESAGVKQEDLLYMLEHSAQLAQAGFTDMDTALSATAKTMNAYGDAAGSAEDIQRVLMQTQNLGITTVGELGASLANVTPTAAAMGVSFEQVGAAMAQMTASGVPTAQATTQLRSAMTELGKAGTKADKAFRAASKGTKYAGMSFQEAMDAGANLGDVFGMMQAYADKSGKSMVDLWGSVEAGNAAMMIASDVDTFNSNLEQMYTDADVVGDAYGKMANTFGTSMKKMKTSAKNFMTALFTGGDVSASFDSLLDSLGDVGQSLIGWLSTGLKTLGENLPGMISSLMDFAGGLIDALAQVDWIEVGTTLINGLIGGIGMLGQKLIELVGGAISSLVSGEVNFGEIGSAIWNGITSIITTAGDWLSKLFNTAVAAVTGGEGGEGVNFADIGSAIWDGVTSIITTAGDWLSDLFGFGVEAASDEETMGYSGIGDAILSGVQSILGAAGTFLSDIFQSGKETVEGEEFGWNKVGDAIKTGVNLVLGAGEFLVGAFEGGAELIKAINWTNVGEHAENLIVEGLDGAATLISTISTAADELINGVEWENVGESCGELLCTGIDGAADILGSVTTAVSGLIDGVEWESVGKSCGELLCTGIDGAADIVGSVSTAVSGLIDGVEWETVGKEAGDLLSTGLSGAANLLDSGFRGAVDFLDGFDWAGLGSKISGGLGDAFSGLGSFLGGLLGGAGDTLAGLGAGAGSVFESLGDKLSKLISGDDMSKSAEELKSAMSDLETAMKNGQESINTTAEGIGSGIKKSIETDLTVANMSAIGQNVTTGIGAGIGLGTVDLAKEVTSLCSDVKKSVEGVEGYWSGAGEKITSGVTKGMGNKSSDLTKKAKALINLAKTEMGKVSFVSVGSNIVTGIVSGVNSSAYLLYNKMKEIAEAALAAAKKSLKVESPSKVMRDEIGKWIPAGIAEGIEENAGMVEDAMGGIASDLASDRMRASLTAQSTGLMAGGIAMEGYGTGTDSEMENQTMLLREQNRLLRLILEKETNVQFGPSVGLGRTVKQSLDMYGLVGG